MYSRYFRILQSILEFSERAEWFWSRAAVAGCKSDIWTWFLLTKFDKDATEFTSKLQNFNPLHRVHIGRRADLGLDRV